MCLEPFSCFFHSKFCYITGRVYHWLETWCVHAQTHARIAFHVELVQAVVSEFRELGPTGIPCSPCGNIGGHCWVFRTSGRWGRIADVNLEGCPKILGQQASVGCAALCV